MIFMPLLKGGRQLICPELGEQQFVSGCLLCGKVKHQKVNSARLGFIANQFAGHFVYNLKVMHAESLNLQTLF